MLVGPFRARDKDVVVACVVPGDPLSKQRPRWVHKGGRAHPYTPEATRLREEGIAAIVRAEFRELITDNQGLFSVRAGFYLATNQARDVDNMLKLICDALTGIVWADDRQVVEVFGFKIPADRREEARTEFLIARLPGVMPYDQQKCLLCHRSFRWYPSWQHRRFCSRRCMVLATQRREPIPCAHCGATLQVVQFKRVANKHHFCGMACKAAFGRESRICAHCGTSFEIAKSYKRQTCSRSCAIKRAWDRAEPRRRAAACRDCGQVAVTRRAYKRCWQCHLAFVRSSQKQERASSGHGVEVTVELA